MDDHVARRAAMCTVRVAGRRGRSQLRNHNSTQCPPNAGHSAISVATGHAATPPRGNAIAAPMMAAIAPVRISVLRSGSRQGWKSDFIALNALVPAT
jgi:hypothetical protein